MQHFEDRLEMISNISNEILSNGLADTRDEAQKMAEDWVDTVIEDMAI